MKCIAVVCCLAFFLAIAHGLLAGSVVDILRRYQDECDQETGVGFDKIALTKELRKFSDSGAMDEFAACMLKKHHILKNNGEINHEVSNSDLFSDNPEIIEKTAKCRAITGKDVHETARKVINCYWDSDVLVLDPTPSKYLRPY